LREGISDPAGTGLTHDDNAWGRSGIVGGSDSSPWRLIFWHRHIAPLTVLEQYWLLASFDGFNFIHHWSHRGLVAGKVLQLKFPSCITSVIYMQLKMTFSVFKSTINRWRSPLVIVHAEGWVSGFHYWVN
jgi:hypothetical protein